MSRIRKYYKSAILFIISGLVLYFSLAALFHSGFPDNHDRNLYMNWLSEFDQGIKDGYLLPRWAPNVWAGYGSPVFNFIQPGFYYLAEGFHLVGFSLISSVKATIILSVVLGYIFMYLFSRALWKNNWAALLSATLFTWSPYHLGGIYLRGSFAELLAMAWWPLILFSLNRFAATLRLRHLLTLAIATAALMLSHNVLSIIFIPIAGAYLLIIAWRRWRVIFFSLGTAIIGAGLSAWFWLPALVEKKYINLQLNFTGNWNYTENFINLIQLISTEWKNYIFLIGLTGLAVIALALYVLLEAPGQRSNYGRKIWFWLVIFVAAVFMSSYLSRFLWDRIYFLHYFQFPWRWLSLVNLVTAVLGGVIVLYHKSVHKYFSPIFLSLGLILLTLLLNFSYSYPVKYLRVLVDQDYQPFRERQIEIKEAVTSGQKTIQIFFFSEMPGFFSTQTRIVDLEEMLKKILAQYSQDLNKDINASIKFPDKLEVIKGQAQISVSSAKTQSYVYQLNVQADSEIKINLLWFPGWTIELDGQGIVPQIDNNLGTMQVSVPEGIHTLSIEFNNTKIRWLAIVIAYLSLAIGILLILFRKYLQRLVKDYTTNKS
ncbi:MAG: hypothetical protein PHI73_03915 [Patescibacteria group bacterium]|nr:hypothetical protein [Patescibacteria group bacterium]